MSSADADGDDHTPREIDLRERVADLTAFQQQILVLLADEADYGLGIKERLEQLYGTEVNHGRLYPNLDALVGENFVERGELDRRTNEYRITTAGERGIVALHEWQRERLSVDPLDEFEWGVDE